MRKPAESMLIPQHRGTCGVQAINALLQEALNPPAPNKAEITLGKNSHLRVGDRLLWLSNQPSSGLVNGTEVTLVAVDGEDGSRRATITDENGDRHTMPVHQLDVTLAYAMTVHKAQGSEYPACIAVFDRSAGPHLLNRRLAYTAITRARRICIVLGQRRALQQAILNNRDDERRSGLLDDLGPID